MTYPTDASDNEMAPIVAGEVEIYLRVSSIATINAILSTKRGGLQVFEINVCPMAHFSSFRQ